MSDGAVVETDDSVVETEEAVGGTGEAVGGTGEAVGGTGEAVGGTGEAVGETGEAVGETGEPVGEAGNEFLKTVKRHLNVTWEDADTDARILDMMADAEIALNHKLGAAPDYEEAGQERRLYLNYMLYAWNGCLNDFDAAYRAEILQIRHKYEVGELESDTEEPAES